MISPTVVKVALLVLSLGLDTFTVAVALGIVGIGRESRVRAASSFALFEGAMPLVGFFVGRLVSGAIGAAASTAGIVVLFGVGAWMIYESLAGDDESDFRLDTWQGLVGTSISVSLDELAIGFGIGALGLPIGITVVLIATQAFVLTLLGTAIGDRVGERLAERAEVVAGVVLCGLALVLAVEQVTGR